MRPHPRPPIIRKTIKWGGAAVTALLVWSLVVSQTRSFNWHEPGHSFVSFTGGAVRANSTGWPGGGVSNHTGVTYWGSAYGLAWVPYWHQTGREWTTIIPAWPLVAASLVVTITAWHLDTLARRRARLNLCPKCNYDRAGIGAGAVCPECGSKGGPA